ncbi:hypothetical protein GGI07_002148 [Coemansia sp. Benny D115]|nr:hypothetical protein GGI07_002148 [Coemansia sp. Benny D115]
MMEFQQTLDSLIDELASTVGVSRRDKIPWNWVATRSSRLMTENSTGVSRTVLMTELEAQWHRLASSDVQQSEIQRTVAPFYNRTDNPPPTTIFGLLVDRMHTIPNTRIWLWTVSGAPDPLRTGEQKEGLRGPNRRDTADMQIDMFVHQRYYPMIDGSEFAGFFNQHRTILATTLWMSDRGGSLDGQPVRTLLPTTALAFVLRIKDDPDLPAQLRQHTDEQLLRDIFGVEYRARRFAHVGAPVFNADQVWCKISEIHPPTREIRNGKPSLCLVMECAYEQETQPVPVNIVFWDDDIAVTRLFKSDDYIGLLCPVVKTIGKNGRPSEIEYGPLTIAFVMHHIFYQPHTFVSQSKIARNELGYFDYSRYAHKLKINQLRPDMNNLTLLARVTAVSENMPLDDEQEENCDRYAVRIADDSGTCDVTFWGDLCRQVSLLQPGQLVLMHGLETSEQSDGGLVVNGGADINSTIYNISIMTGILTSTGLRQYSTLALIPAECNRYVKACVIDVMSFGDHLRDARDRLSATMLVHSVCQRPVRCRGRSLQAPGCLENPTDMYLFDCPSCGKEHLPAAHVVSVFALCMVLDDGTDAVTMQVSTDAARRIMRFKDSK